MPTTIVSWVAFRARIIHPALPGACFKGMVLHDRRNGWPAVDSVLVWVHLARRATCIKVRIGRMVARIEQGIDTVVMSKVVIGEVVN